MNRQIRRNNIIKGSDVNEEINSSSNDIVPYKNGNNINYSDLLLDIKKLLVSMNDINIKQITPNNTQEYSIRFTEGTSEYTLQLNIAGTYNRFVLTNPSASTSISWNNVSSTIGNNKIKLEFTSPTFFDNPNWTIGGFDNTGAIPPAPPALENINSFTWNPAKNYTNKNFSWQTGQINPADGTYDGSVLDGTYWTTYAEAPENWYWEFVDAWSTNPDYEFLISTYWRTDGISGGLPSQTVVYDETKSMIVYSNTSESNPITLEINPGPTYTSLYPPPSTTYPAIYISVRKTNGGVITLNELQNVEMFRVLTDRYDFVSNVWSFCYTPQEREFIVPGAYNATSGDSITISYGYTFDYDIVFRVVIPDGPDGSYKSVLNDIFTIPPNPNQNTLAYVTFPHLEGAKLYFDASTTDFRPFNPGDVTNLNYILKTLTVGNTESVEIIIPDNYYTGIYTQPEPASPNATWQTIKELVEAASFQDGNKTLDITVNDDLTVNFQSSNIKNSITLTFYYPQYSQNVSPGRFFGVYYSDSINIPIGAVVKSTKKIDLFSSGRFNLIKVVTPTAIVNSNERGTLIELKPSAPGYAGQIINASDSSFKRILPLSSQPSTLRFNIVDNYNLPITLWDVLTFSITNNAYYL